MTASSSADSSDKLRLVLVSVNMMTAVPETLIEATVQCLHEDPKRNLLISDQPHALARLFAERQLATVKTLDASRLPLIAEPRQGVIPRRRFLGRVIEEDSFITQLPIAGSERTDNAVFFWDRLQWLVAERDPRPFVSDLPWDRIEELFIVGNSSQASSLTGLIAAEACRHKLPITGLVRGPVVGRFFADMDSRLRSPLRRASRAS